MANLKNFSTIILLIASFNVLHLTLCVTFVNSNKILQHIDQTYLANSPAVTAIADIIDVFYVEQRISFDIYVFGKKSRKISQIVDGILEKNVGGYKTTVKWFPDVTRKRLIFNQSAIVLFVNQTSIPMSTMTYKCPKDRKFLFFCLLDFCNVTAIHDKILVRKLNVSPYLFILNEREAFLRLFTYEWWTKKSCNRYILTAVNSFNKSSMLWKQNLKNYEKFRDFHGCQLILGISDHFHQTSRKHMKTSPLFVIFKIMARMRNFTPNFIILLETNEKRSYHIKMETTSLAIESINNLSTAGVFYESSANIYVSPGALYTPYEKILLPFDEDTWYFLIATFAAAFSVIFIVNLMPDIFRNLIYGDGVNMPAFNVVGTFFGIGQLKLPKGNFARIILITFIFFCLIIRTAYQGVQFDMLTREMRRKPAQSLQQLYDENYTIWGLYDTKIQIQFEIMMEPSKR